MSTDISDKGSEDKLEEQVKKIIRIFMFVTLTN